MNILMIVEILLLLFLIYSYPQSLIVLLFLLLYFLLILFLFLFLLLFFSLLCLLTTFIIIRNYILVKWIIHMLLELNNSLITYLCIISILCDLFSLGYYTRIQISLLLQQASKAALYLFSGCFSYSTSKTLKACSTELTAQQS